MMEHLYVAYVSLINSYVAKSLLCPLTEYEMLCYEQVCRTTQAFARMLERNLLTQLGEGTVEE